MKKLMEQILKFGIVGFISFFIDFVITNIIAYICRKFGAEIDTAALIGGFWGFTISVVFNYLLSMKFVFVRKEGMDRRKEFVIFVVLSLVGLVLNELIIKISIDVVYSSSLIELFCRFASEDPAGLITAAAKIIATAIVMVYNFITRKLFLEQKEEKAEVTSE